MSSRHKLAALIVAACTSLSLVRGADNILLIIADDIGVDMLDCYGEGSWCDDMSPEAGRQCDPLSSNCCKPPCEFPDPHCVNDYPDTRTICGTLAPKGIRFKNAWSDPACSPTRATILTGKYGFDTGVMAPSDILPAPAEPCDPFDFVTLPCALSASSTFRHGAFGKWHLDGNMPDPSHPTAHGFSTYVGAMNNLGFASDLRHCDGVDTLCADGNHADCSSCGSGNCNGDPTRGDYYHWPKVANAVASVFPPCAVPPPENDPDGYVTTEERKVAQAWILDPGESFAWLAFHAPHSVYHVPPQILVYDPDWDLDTDCTSLRRRCYKWMIEAMDSEIGNLINAVDEDLSDTTVIFVGDNGTETSVATDPPFVSSRAKGTVYEGGINVPLIISGAAIDPSNQGSTSSAMIHTIDIYATVLELAGATVPSDVDSVSLVPVLNSPSASVRSS